MGKMTTCKTCGAEIAASAKTCPSCGAKNKRPVVGKWWFWAIIVVALIVTFAGGSGRSTSPVGSSGVKSTTSSFTSSSSAAESKTADPYAGLTTGQKNALRSANQYLNYSAFSHDGLIKQLEFEQYSTADATYAADHCGADWNEQAAKCAKNYLDLMSFSRDGLIQQLEFEGFTHEQAVYGAKKNGY